VPVADAARVPGRDRHPESERLEARDPERLLPARRHEQRLRAPVDPGHRRVTEPARDLEAAALQLGPQRTGAGEDQGQAEPRAAPRLDRVAHALGCHQAAREQHAGRPGRRGADLQAVGPGRSHEDVLRREPRRHQLGLHVAGEHPYPQPAQGAQAGGGHRVDLGEVGPVLEAGGARLGRERDPAGPSLAVPLPARRAEEAVVLDGHDGVQRAKGLEPLRVDEVVDVNGVRAQPGDRLDQARGGSPRLRESRPGVQGHGRGRGSGSGLTGEQLLPHASRGERLDGRGQVRRGAAPIGPAVGDVDQSHRRCRP
jgi:hypothetical protein